MTTRTLVDTDSVQIVANKWLDDVRQYQQNVDTLWKHGTINAALSNIGTSTHTTLVVTENTAVNANTDLTSYPNIHWLFLGSGKLTPATGVTLTLYSPDTITADPGQHILDATSGAVIFANGGTVYAPWFGVRTSAADNATTLQAANNACPQGASMRSTLVLPIGTCSVSTGLRTTGRNIHVRGQGIDRTILSVTSNASSNHGIGATGAMNYLGVSDLTIQASSAPSTLLNMKAIDFDYSVTTMSGAVLDVRRVKVRSMNFGVFCDGRDSGGTSYLMTSAVIEDCDIKIASAAASVAECIAAHGCDSLTIRRCTLDNNSLGDHIVYAIRNRSALVSECLIKNSVGSSASGVKLCTELVGDTGVLDSWVVEKTQFSNVVIGALVRLVGDVKVRSSVLTKNVFATTTTTNSSEGSVMVNLLNASQIQNVQCDSSTFDTAQGPVINFQIGASAIVHHAAVKGCSFFNWGVSSSGTYGAINTSSSGTIKLLELNGNFADGNSNGRTIFSDGTIGASCKRLAYSDLVEVNTTTPGYPVTFTDADTSPSVAFGNDFTCTNSGATSITQFDDVVRGETYRIRFTNGNTTLVDGANLILAGSANVTTTADDIYVFACPDGVKLYEQSRSLN